MKAECAGCGRYREVCCDSGYEEKEDGTTEHDSPFCEDCCHKMGREPDNHD